MERTGRWTKEVVTFYSERGENMPGLLKDWPDFIARQMDEIPKEFRETASVDISSYNDGYGCDTYDVPTFTIAYTRPETDAEYHERQQQYQAQMDERMRQELATLRHLQSKYGASNG